MGGVVLRLGARWVRSGAGGEDVGGGRGGGSRCGGGGWVGGGGEWALGCDGLQLIVSWAARRTCSFKHVTQQISAS